jgi:hypothetical protein
VQTAAWANDPSFVMLDDLGPVADWLRGGHSDYCGGKCSVGTTRNDVPVYLTNPMKVNDKSTFVNLVGLFVSPKTIGAISGSQHLRNLYLSNTNANDAMCASIGSCSNLYCLDLSWDNITADGLKEIAKLQHLHILKLRGVSITPATAEILAGMPALDYLDISATDADSVRNILATKGFPILRTLAVQQIDFTNLPRGCETPTWPKLYTVALDQSTNVDPMLDVLGHFGSLKNIRAFQLKVDDANKTRAFGKMHDVYVFDEDYMNAQ